MAEDTPNRRAAATNVPDWVRDHYRLVDAAELDSYINDFDPNVKLRFANTPPVTGREAAREGLAKGHAHHDMAHTIVGFFEDGDTAIVEFEVDYTYRDGNSARIPSLAVIHRSTEGLFDDVRIYLDPQPPS